MQKNIFKQKDFGRAQQRTSHIFFAHRLHNLGYLKQWDKASNVHRSSLFTQREKTTDNHIPLGQTYHTTIVLTNKSVIKE